MFKKVIVVFLAMLIFAACQPEKKEILYPRTDLSNAPLIPKPVKTVATHSAFGLDQNTVIKTTSDKGFEKVGHFLSEKIKWQTGLQIPVNDPTKDEPYQRFIYISHADTIELKKPESYQLYIKQDSIFINSSTAAGAFRGVQTLRQLIPEKSNDTLTDHPLWLVPTGKIIDGPRFEFRGTMLDVARHFFTVEEVKKYIDLLAYYKYNMLHLHLSDDQGWRIEIKSWPKLTEVGGSTEVGGGDGGFYTQEDFKELVDYAAERHITIIPEIDMPGHTNAASLSYPFLNGNGKTLKPYTGTRVGFSTFATNKDTVYAFLNDVVREIASISPGPYFHIGGDESHVTPKKGYIHFVELMEKIVRKHGKTMIGWNEIAQADISSSSVVQLWKEKKHALKAAQNGSKIILSSAEKAYLDMKYDSLSTYGLDWAGHIPVDSAYAWNPETYIEGLPKESILGIEAPLWSETISNSPELEYLAFPRAIGYSELAWSIQEHCDWNDYRKRLARHTPYLERMQVNYYPTKLVDWKK
ncbi:family 20 glycosylhydrolase [Muricauda sp. JGD-17]|uniref:beta-N-acetylhexosaminidase n=1 Tax=Flagellimonas ochracea TaxID=2696472 RepID=A0A964T8V5_9FLAO|nr:family 20 glycosylhydrolase [Allomuricauda ochracea]NAY90387.1 family 20 glycosylhydrolase [Allomuricauda ochracea]